MPLSNGSDSIVDAIGASAGSIIEYFINFGNEIGVFQTVLLDVIFVGVGLLISASAVLDLTRMKNPRYQSKITPASVATRFMIGPATIQLDLFMRAFAGSIFGDPMVEKASLSALSYTDKASSADPTSALLLVIVGFLVFVGWVSALRAMIAFSRMGNPQENGYQLFRAGAARLVAATALCMFQFVMDDIIESFSGQAGMFSSQLNL
ncbi:hypothetical protein [Marinobacter subterrani]|uniref:hypothetical protein n=1 Tax=Marinobacter subterrani TaxID=1658765 RepID=UPI002353B953|nr:hypothetical protein [Marinobacter subterrani]